MKVELISYCSGALSIELVAESDVEERLLTNAWKVMESGDGPYRGNGRTITDRGSTGFFLPVTNDAHPDTRKPKAV